MRLNLDLFGEGDQGRAIGAAVVRATAQGGVVLDLGPADGPPLMRLQMSRAEAMQLLSSVEAVANGKDEAIMIVED